MITEAQELLKLGSNPMSAVADTSAKSDKTPMTSSDLNKARELQAKSAAKSSAKAPVKKKIR